MFDEGYLVEGLLALGQFDLNLFILSVRMNINVCVFLHYCLI